jgi:hypothetical protein
MPAPIKVYKLQSLNMFGKKVSFQEKFRFQLMLWTNSWNQNSQKVLPYKHFGGYCPLDTGLYCDEGPMHKLLLWTNQKIAGIL